MISHVSVCLLAHEERLDFKHFLSRKTRVQLFGSSDRLYSRFFLLSSNYFNTVLLFEQGYKLYLR